MVIRGLSLFIGEIRNCQNKKQEEKVVLEEMAKIRARFFKGGLSAYDRKKYVWKLIYAHILGYEVQFGHDVAVSLINCSKFSDKCTGYIAVGIMLNETADANLFANCIETIKNDLTCGIQVNESLALSTLGNIGSAELARELAPAVIHKVFSSEKQIPVYTKKKACLCLLSFLRREREFYDSKKWVDGFKILLNNTNYGLLLSATALLHGTITIFGSDGFECLIPALIEICKNIQAYSQDYFYYMTPCPWLQVRILKVLQLYSQSAFKSSELKKDVNQYVRLIFSAVEVTKHVNKNNSDHSILFEAINLVLKLGDVIDRSLQKDTVNILAKFVSVNEPNIKYLGLDALSRLQPQHLALANVKDGLMKDKMEFFFTSLKEADVSIRRRALDSIFYLCTEQTAGEVVNELLDYLQRNDYDLMEQMVLKIAILAEKFAPNLNWYIEVVIKLIEFAGDYVDEDLWFRVAQMVTGFGATDDESNEGLQRFAARKMLDVMKRPSIHEAMVKIGAFVLSEFGYLIANEPESDVSVQFGLVDSKLHKCSNSGKAVLLTAIMKLVRHEVAQKDSKLVSRARTILVEYQNSWDVDIQQRACEYVRMLDLLRDNSLVQMEDSSLSLVQRSLEKMPNFSEDIKSNNFLTRRILALKSQSKGLGQKETAKTEQRNMADAIMQGRASNLLELSNPVQKEQPMNILEMETQKEANLLELLESNDQPFNLAPSSLPLDLFSNDPNIPLQRLKFQDAHPADFAPTQSVVQSAQNPLLESLFAVANGSQWKSLLPFSCKDGVLYSDNELEITISMSTLKYMVRSQLSFKTKNGTQPQNIETSLNLNGSSNMVQCSAVKYSVTEPPQVIVMAMLSSVDNKSPDLLVSCTVGPSKKNLRLLLPLFVNKVFERVDLPADAFDRNWNELTVNRPATFEKADFIFKNPAPSHIPLDKVLQQIANFCEASLNLKTLPISGTKLRGVGQVALRPDSQPAFPKSPNDMQPATNVALMVEAEFYLEDTSDFRFSVRAAPQQHLASAVANLLSLFITK